MKKELFERKLLLQILSIVMAAVLWFAVTYTEDPYIKLPVNSIPISYLGEAAMEKNGLLLVNKESIPPAALDVKGKRSDVRSALGSIRATVDLSDITEPGEYTKEVTYDIPNSSVTVVKRRAETVNVSIEAVEKKTIPVVVNKTAEDRNKEFLVKSTAKESNITISGAKEDIEKIYAAAATVQADTIVESQEKTYAISYIDKNKAPVTLKHAVKASVREITVTNTVYLRKSVPITLDERNDTADYQVFVKSFSQDKIEIGVSKQSYESISAIGVDFAEDVTMGENKKYKMKLIVPEDVYCPDKDAEIYMTADVENIVTQSVMLPLVAEHTPEDITVTFEHDTVPVTLTGPASRFAGVSAAVDLSGLSAGEYQLPVQLSGDPEGVTAADQPVVRVTLQTIE